MEPLEVDRRLTLPPDELRVQFARSGGPGGQNVNKVETRVQLRWSVARSAVLSEAQRERILTRLASRLTREGELIVSSSRHRERARNIEDARERLAATLREALHEERARRATKPTRGSVRRRLQEKRERGERKQRRRPPGED